MLLQTYLRHSGQTSDSAFLNGKTASCSPFELESEKRVRNVVRELNLIAIDKISSFGFNDMGNDSALSFVTTGPDDFDGIAYVESPNGHTGKTWRRLSLQLVSEYFNNAPAFGTLMQVLLLPIF